MERLAVVLVLGALASSCGVTTRVQPPVERPSLEVPPAPPRLIEAAPAPEAPPVEPQGEIVPPAPAPPVTKKPLRDRDTTQKPAEPKPEPVPPPVDPPPPQTQNSQPAPVLLTPATADTTVAIRQIKEAIGRAQSALSLVDYQRLNEDRKTAYNDAKDFITGAEAALKDSNFDLAKGLANNAEKLVKELTR
jgi:hypothetical protein